MIKKITHFITIPLSIISYKLGLTRLPYLPAAIWIEPTNACNLKCIMCPNSIINQYKRGYMSLDLFKKIIDEAKNFTAYTVLCISGEPLLHPKFDQMIKIAKQNNIATYVSTNCTLLTPALSRKILEAGLDWINFSFDGTTKKVYEGVRVNANFEKSLQNVVNFLKLKKKLNAKTRAELQILIMDDKGEKDYREHIAGFKSNFKDLPLDYIQTRRPSTWGGFLSGTKKYIPKVLGKVFSPCSYLWGSLHLLWDGRVVACTSDFFGDNVLGKFPEKSLAEIWNDKPMRNFRKAMLEKKYLKYNKNCRDCDALWEPRILGLPSGLRGINATVANSIFGKNLFGFFKKIAKLANPAFGMDVVKED